MNVKVATVFLYGSLYYSGSPRLGKQDDGARGRLAGACSRRWANAKVSLGFVVALMNSMAEATMDYMTHDQLTLEITAKRV